LDPVEARAAQALDLPAFLIGRNEEADTVGIRAGRECLDGTRKRPNAGDSTGS
jgi:hypothetical protein